jgi:hypothetical protein
MLVADRAMKMRERSSTYDLVISAQIGVAFRPRPSTTRNRAACSAISVVSCRERRIFLKSYAAAHSGLRRGAHSRAVFTNRLAASRTNLIGVASVRVTCSTWNVQEAVVLRLARER